MGGAMTSMDKQERERLELERIAERERILTGAVRLNIRGCFGHFEACLDPQGGELTPRDAFETAVGTLAVVLLTEYEKGNLDIVNPPPVRDGDDVNALEEMTTALEHIYYVCMAGNPTDNPGWTLRKITAQCQRLADKKLIEDMAPPVGVLPEDD